MLWRNTSWQKGLTKFTRCDSLTITEMRADLISTTSRPCDADQRSTVLIFKSMESESQQDSVPFIRGDTFLSHVILVFFYCPLASHWLIFTNFTVCIQWPDQVNHQTHAPLLMVNIQEAAFNFDPLLYAWLLFSPSTIPHTNISKIPTRPSFIPNDTNAQR